MSRLLIDPTARTDATETRGMDAELDEELQVLQSAGLRRSLRQVHQRRAGTVLLDGERVADFASNDYLGLAADPRLSRAASAVLQAEGVGAGAARLISGNHPIHEGLERAVARFKGCEHALLCIRVAFHVLMRLIITHCAVELLKNRIILPAVE